MGNAFVNPAENVIVGCGVTDSLWQIFMRGCLHVRSKFLDGACVACVEESLESFLCILLCSVCECKVPEVNISQSGWNEGSGGIPVCQLEEVAF